MSNQQTLVLIKPDAVKRRLIGTILQRFEARGFRIRALAQREPDGVVMEEHYIEHRGREYFESLVGFMVSGPLVALVLEGEEAISAVRAMLGSTDGRKAPPGTIRGDLCLSNQQNLVHASDSETSAKRELDLWFPSGY